MVSRSVLSRALISFALALTRLLFHSPLSQHDRQWMVVDAETLKACTARSDPEVRALGSCQNLPNGRPDSSTRPFSLPDGAHRYEH